MLYLCFFFELPQYYKWYVQRTGEPHKEILKEYISLINRGMAPVVPHTAEEAWRISGGDEFILQQSFPKGFEPNLELVTGENLVKQTLEDTRAILKMVKIEKPPIKLNWSQWNDLHATFNFVEKNRISLI